MITHLSDRPIQLTAPLKLLYQEVPPYVAKPTTATYVLNENIFDYELLLILYCDTQGSQFVAGATTLTCELMKQEAIVPTLQNAKFLLETPKITVTASTAGEVGKRVLQISSTNTISSLYVGNDGSATQGNSTWDRYGVITEIYGVKGVQL